VLGAAIVAVFVAFLRVLMFDVVDAVDVVLCHGDFVWKFYAAVSYVLCGHCMCVEAECRQTPIKRKLGFVLIQDKMKS